MKKKLNMKQKAETVKQDDEFNNKMGQGSEGR